jgi:3-deoxy-D-manno-octulosonic-acid transferase
MAAKTRLPLTLKLYRGVTRLGAPLAAAILLAGRLRRGKEDPGRVGERRGTPSADRPEGPLVWVHGASVGEVLAVLPLVERIRSRSFAVLLTSGTVTSARLMQERLPEGVLHQFVPLDAPVFVRRFLDHWQPDLALFAESEFWPNLITEATERGTPCVLINGRLSVRSFERWRLARGTASALLKRFDLCLTQEPEDADRLTRLGAAHVVTTGNIKFDVPPPPAEAEALGALKRAFHRRPVVLAASTHAGEEEAVIDAHLELQGKMPDLLTIVVPRHPERGSEVVELVEQAGLTPVMRSRGYLPDRGTAVYIADTIGELGLFYRLAPIVFVGGSLIRHGGQNPIEPAKLGCAILHGPYVANFASIYAQLNRAHGAAMVTDADSMALSFARLINDPQLAKQMATAARKTVEKLGGALERTFAAIDPYLVQLRLQR